VSIEQQPEQEQQSTANKQHTTSRKEEEEEEEEALEEEYHGTVSSPSPSPTTVTHPAYPQTTNQQIPTQPAPLPLKNNNIKTHIKNTYYSVILIQNSCQPTQPIQTINSKNKNNNNRNKNKNRNNTRNNNRNNQE
jgi:hypothetical protein